MRYKKLEVFILISIILLDILLSSFALASSSNTDLPLPKPKPKEKVVYLTFNDGPNKYTPKIVSILDKYKIKGTFFMLEPQIKANKKLILQISKKGNSIGLHGVTHIAKKAYSSPQSLIGEMNKCNDTLNKVTKKKSSLIRVPYGSKPYMKDPYRSVVIKAGYYMWDWNVDSGDTKKSNISKEYIIKSTEQQINKLTKDPVILFHDKENTVKALPVIINFLKKKGYKFKTINTNMRPQNFWNDERAFDFNQIKKTISPFTIMGKPIVTKEQIKSYVISVNSNPKIKCSIDELIDYYFYYGAKEGVRADIAFAQSVHETGYFNFGGQVLPEQNNYSGLGATNNSPVGKGAWFNSPAEGVLAQIQHLKAYGSTVPLKTTLIDPRFSLVKRGSAKNVVQLAQALNPSGTGWAYPGFSKAKYNNVLDAYLSGETYGQSIIRIITNIKKQKSKINPKL